MLYTTAIGTTLVSLRCTRSIKGKEWFFSVRCSPGHGALLRRLYRTLDAPSWKAFCAFHRSLAGRFTGESFELLTDEELATMSAYATLARKEAASSNVER